MSRVFRRLASTVPAFTPEKPDRIRQLLRPVGVATKPQILDSSPTKTFQERKAEFLDVKKNRERREELKEEFAKSSFEHIYGMRDTGGKIFTAPPQMFAADQALYMPNIVGKSLEDSFGGESSVSQLLSTTTPNIVRLFSSTLGQQQIKQFCAGMDLQKLGVKLIDVNIPTSWVNRMLVRWSVNSIRKSEIGNDAAFHKYIIANQKLTINVQKSLSATNELAGYLYVVDQNQKIRWATSGPVVTNEKERLLSVLEELKNHE